MITATIRHAADDHVAATDDPSILGAILMPRVTLALWMRVLPPDVAVWLDAIDVGTIDDIALTCAMARADVEIADAMAAAGYPAVIEMHWLRDDIASLVRRFAAILDIDAVAIRLDVIETDACRRFHADYVTARAITTYRGSGTQWLSSDDAARLVGGSPLDVLDIADIATGTVAMMKGRLWAPDAPLVHRSPPIAGIGIARLTLTLDSPRRAED